MTILKWKKKKNSASTPPTSFSLVGFDFVVVCDVVAGTAGPLAYKSRGDSSFFLQRFTRVQ
jgi:hypothetical protein